MSRDEQLKAVRAIKAATAGTSEYTLAVIYRLADILEAVIVSGGGK